MTPAQAIKALDKALSAHGETLHIARPGTPEITVLGFVRKMDANGTAGLVQQGDRSVILSPTGLGALGLPKVKDGVSVAGVTGTVEAVEPIRLQDILVRINLTVRLAL